MADVDVDALLFGALPDPSEATEVADGDDARTGRFKVFEMAGHFRFGDVVDAVTDFR